MGWLDSAKITLGVLIIFSILAVLVYCTWGED